MMTIPNTQQETLQQLLPRVQEHYPQAKIKKIFLSPEAIIIPHNNYKFVVRRHKENLKIDHTLPILYAIGAIVISMIFASILMSIIYGRPVLGIGGAIWIVLGIFVMKYVFQRIKKEEFERFRVQMSSMSTGFDFDRQPPASVPPAPPFNNQANHPG